MQETRDMASIPGSGRIPGEENGNLLQYSCLGNPMYREDRQATVLGVTKSQTYGLIIAVLDSVDIEYLHYFRKFY